MNMTSKAAILVIEDDPEQVRLYGRILCGYRVEFAATASAALALLAEFRPDLILLDHVLADGERGADFLPQIKQAAAHVPVIVASGTLAIRQQMAVLQGPLAAHYVLEKPLDLDLLEQTVERALRECGVPEAVEVMKSLNRGEKQDAGDPDKRHTERVERQRAMLAALRSGAAVNVSAFAREHRVDRHTIRRDLQDMVKRGELNPSVIARDE